MRNMNATKQSAMEAIPEGEEGDGEGDQTNAAGEPGTENGTDDLNDTRTTQQFREDMAPAERKKIQQAIEQ